MYSGNSKVTPDQLKAHLKSLKKDNVGVEEYKGKYRLNIARDYSRLYFKDKDGKPATQKRVPTGISVFDSKGKIDKTNANEIDRRVTHMNSDLIHGQGLFDTTLVKYGFLGEVPKDEAPPKKQKSLLELYDWYCENRTDLEETTLKLDYQGSYKRALVRALEAGNTEALDIRNYLINNGSLQIAKRVLSVLEHTYNFGIKHNECSANPFTGMVNEIKLSKKRKSQSDDDSDDDDKDSDKRAFTLKEMNAIIEAFETPKRKHFAPIIKFLFWTGCRTGEAIGFKWRDVKWDKEVICIRRTYNQNLKIFKPTKTRIVRWVPMPKDGRLWNLLKSLPEGEPKEVVFKAKRGGIINRNHLATIWTGNESGNNAGVIKRLITENKISQYLKLYATRHTFITIQIRDEGIAPETVAQWCGHDEQMTKKSYLDKDRFTVPGESTTTTPASNSNSSVNLIDMVTNLTPGQLNELKALLNK